MLGLGPRSNSCATIPRLGVPGVCCGQRGVVGARSPSTGLSAVSHRAQCQRPDCGGPQCQRSSGIMGRPAAFSILGNGRIRIPNVGFCTLRLLKPGIWYRLRIPIPGKYSIRTPIGRGTPSPAAPGASAPGAGKHCTPVKHSIPSMDLLEGIETVISFGYNNNNILIVP